MMATMSTGTPHPNGSRLERVLHTNMSRARVLRDIGTRMVVAVMLCGSTACAGVFPFRKRPASAPEAAIRATRSTSTTRTATGATPRPSLSPIPAEAPDVEPEPAASDSAGIARLVRLAHLWHTVALHHPSVATLGIPWDSALIIAAPRVRAAPHADTLARAYQRMIALLRDPSTRLESSRALDPAPVAVATERTGDSLLVLTLAPSASLDAADSVVVRNGLEKLPTRVLLDLRGAPVRDPTHRAQRLDAFFRTTGLTEALVSGTITGPTEHTRRIGTWPTANYTDGAGAFHDEWSSATAPSYSGRASATQKIVILADAGTVLPGVALALHDAGDASLVADGELRDAAPVARVRVPLSDSLVAVVRIGELVHADGSVSVVPDTTAQRSTAETADAAKALALALLRSSAPLPLAQRPLRWFAPAARTPVFYDTTSYPFLGARLLAGFRLWSTMRARHAHRDLYEDDLDAVFERVIPLLEAARNADEYGKAVAELVASLDDGEGALQGATPEGVIGDAALPFRLRMIEGRAFLADVIRDSVTTSLSLLPSTEITALDGYPLVAWFSERRRLMPAANEWSRQRLLTQALSRGRVGEAMIKVRDANNRERTIMVPRTVAYRLALPRIERPSGVAVRLLAEGYSYVDVERLTSDDADRDLRAVMSSRGAVLDLRGTFRISDTLLLRRFATVPTASVARLIQRTLPEPCAASIREALARCTDLRESRAWTRSVDTAGSYSGRLVALIDERTQGAMERFALSLEHMTNVTFIGSSSGGSVSWTTPLSLPGGLTTGIATQELRKPDGGQVQRVGLTPTIETRPTVRGGRAGDDEVLARALQWLQQQLDPPVRRKR